VNDVYQPDGAGLVEAAFGAGRMIAGAERQHDNVTAYASVFLEHYKAETKAGPPSKLPYDQFLGSRHSDEILLKYPIEGDLEQIEAVASELTEAKGCAAPNEARNAATRATLTGFQTVRVEDYHRLAPTKWLNDTLINFWLAWYVGTSPVRCSRASS
jgi:hypothetical protein